MTPHRTHSLPPAVHKIQLTFRTTHHLKISDSDQHSSLNETCRESRNTKNNLKKQRTTSPTESKYCVCKYRPGDSGLGKTRAPHAGSGRVSPASPDQHSADKCVVHFFIVSQNPLTLFLELSTNYNQIKNVKNVVRL